MVFKCPLSIRQCPRHQRYNNEQTKQKCMSSWTLYSSEQRKTVNKEKVTSGWSSKKGQAAGQAYRGGRMPQARGQQGQRGGHMLTVFEEHLGGYRQEKMGLWIGKGDHICMALQVIVSTIVFALNIIKIIKMND